MEAGRFLNPTIAVVGGGSGVRAVITGLVRYAANPIAICGVFDSGGSTGRLRDEFGDILPPGDLRNVFEALIPPEGDFVRRLFAHRFESNGGGLTDHSLGNLLFLGAEQVMKDPIAGLHELSRLCNIRGQVLPVSLDNAHLRAELSDGWILEGEAAIDLRGVRDLADTRTITRVSLSRRSFVCRQAVEALFSAEVVVLGPGDLYTSVIPNLLVEGVVDTLNRCRGKLVYVCNLMTKWGETPSYTAADFVDTLYHYGLERELDAVVLNDGVVPEAIRTDYWDKERAAPVDVSGEVVTRISGRAKRVVSGNLLSPGGLSNRLVRHNSAELARTILEL